MSANTGAPKHRQLVTELGLLREAGLPKLRTLSLPGLREIAERVNAVDGPADDVPLIGVVLRQAVEHLGGGQYGDSAAALLGLQPGTRGLTPSERRTKAAEPFNRSVDSFRKRYEPLVVSELADELLALYTTSELRHTRQALERRHPAESRLAVQWVERFEAYHRLWTPAWALAADLTAYRSTLLDEARPYDRAAGTDGPNDEGYTQECQAEGYARFALYRYASFAWELRQFILRYGGMWLLSTPEAELEASDAVYRISWHVTPYNERDESWLRGVIGESRGREMDHFLHLLATTSTGQRVHREWQDWAVTCACTWDRATLTNEKEHFPTAKRQPGVSAACQVHQVVDACGRYCDTIEAEWQRIADWYHLDATLARGVSPLQLKMALDSHQVHSQLSQA